MISFFAPDSMPKEALAKEPSNKDFIKTGGLFKPGFFIFMGFVGFINPQQFVKSYLCLGVCLMR